MSRPLKSHDAKRLRYISFRLTDAEYLTLQVLAQQAGRPPNEFARMVVTKRNPEASPASHNRLDPAFVKRIDAIGLTLRQMQRDAEKAGQVPPELAPLLDRISEVIKEAIRERIKE